MAEREDTGYKVTDRRKYNPDGSPRESADSETAPVAAEDEPKARIPESAANNVVSFPAEAAKKQPEPLPQAASVGSETNARGDSPGAQSAVSQGEKDYNQARGPQSSRLPEASFLSLANMLAVEAAMHLGLIQNPGEEAPPADLEAARHLIDMLGMLQSKTRGNLTGEEDSLLENILADLRMQFVALSKRQ
jgi:hypothetical protein